MRTLLVGWFRLSVCPGAVKIIVLVSVASLFFSEKAYPEFDIHETGSLSGWWSSEYACQKNFIYLDFADIQQIPQCRFCEIGNHIIFVDDSGVRAEQEDRYQYKLNDRSDIVVITDSNTKNSKEFFRCYSSRIPQEYSSALLAYFEEENERIFFNMRGALSAEEKWLIDECYLSFDTGFYQTALSLCAQAYEKTYNPKSAYLVSEIYRNGFAEMERNYDLSFEWLGRSAKLGHSDSFGWMGWSYRFGHGVERDLRKALSWYIRSANTVNPEVAYSIATIYLESGSSIPLNKIAAADWAKKAAEVGNNNAQIMLAVMYAHGMGVEQSFSKAVYWFEQASDDPKAAYNLGWMYKLGLGVGVDWDKSELKFKQAADNGISSGETIRSEYHIIWPREEFSVIFWLRVAADVLFLPALFVCASILAVVATIRIKNGSNKIAC